MVFNFLRFRQRPPGKEAPPNDRVDVFHDAVAGKMVARNARNEAVLFDAAGGSTSDLTTSDGTTAAAAGELGEFLESSGSEALTNYSTTTISSITLTAGDWDVEGVMYISGELATIVVIDTGFSTNGTWGGGGDSIHSSNPRTTAEDSSDIITLPRRRFLVTTPTVVNLLANVSFLAGAVAAYGTITARRVR